MAKNIDNPWTLATLREVRERISKDIIHTAQWRNDPLSDLFGSNLQLKLENLQRTGSFKIRGASNKLAGLLREHPTLPGLVAASAGNHAQGVARAGLQHRLPVIVVMPINAPLTKIESCRKMGASIILFGENLEEATVEAQRIAVEKNYSLMHAYDDWDVIGGQASCGLEMFEDCPAMTVAIVPLGGGGLIGGIAMALKMQKPDIRIIGVQTESVCPYKRFLTEGILDPVPIGAHTIADGIKVKRPGERNAIIIKQYVDEIVTVDDNAIAEAMVVLLERTRTIGEGAGVVGLAALLKNKIRLRPEDHAVLVISGGNVDMSLVGRSIEYGLSASGRLASIVVTVSDSPGRLQQLLRTVANLGMNVRHVSHRRGELHVPIGMTEIVVQIESRDSEHQQALIDELQQQGLAARLL